MAIDFINVYSDPEAYKRALEEHIDNLEREIESLKRQRPQYDCKYSGGDWADISGSHCPLDNPCLTCKHDRLIDRLCNIPVFTKQNAPFLFTDDRLNEFILKDDLLEILDDYDDE